MAAVTLAYMAIGAVDDWRSLTRRTNTGLSPRGKLLLQALAAVGFLVWAHQGGWLGGGVPGDLGLPFGRVLTLGLLIWPLALFVFLAESNATNLTDGLDGLAAGCGAIVFTGMGLQLMLRGHGGIRCWPPSARPWRAAGSASSARTGTRPGCSWATRAPWPWGLPCPPWPC